MKRVLDLLLLNSILIFSFSNLYAEESAVAASKVKKNSIDEILGRDPSRSDYVVEEDCIYAAHIERFEVIDKKHLIIEMKAKEYFMVQFKNNCPDLRRNGPVMYDRRGARLCRHDTIRGIRDSGMNGFEPGLPCFIPGFQSVSKEQVVLLRESMKKARAEHRKTRWRLFPRKKMKESVAL